MSLVKSGTMALALSFAALTPQFAFAQAIPVPSENLQAIVAICTQDDQALCADAIQAAMAALAALNPGVPVERLLGALMAEIAAEGNAAVLAGNTQLATAMAVAASALAEVAQSAGAPANVIATYQQVSASFNNNTTVDVTQVNEVTDTPTTAPDTNASAV